MQMKADAVTVTNEYATYENQLLVKTESEGPGLPASTTIDPDAHPRIVEAQLLDARAGTPRNVFVSGEDIAVRVTVRNARVPVPLTLAVGFTRSDGTLMFAGHTLLDGVALPTGDFVATLHVEANQLLSGEFVVPIWLLDQNGVHRFHELPAATNLIVQNRTKEVGLFRHPHHWDVASAVAGR